MRAKQVVMSPDEVETIMTDWTTAKVLCGPQVTGSQGLSAVALHFDPGKGHSRHRHTDAEQIIYVVSGQGEHIIELEDGKSVTRKIGPGSLIYIPRGAYHSTCNTGWGPMHVFAVFSPPGPEVSLRELGDSGGVGTPELKVLPPGQVPERR